MLKNATDKIFSFIVWLLSYVKAFTPIAVIVLKEMK
jgi:hypothetical protein